MSAVSVSVIMPIYNAEAYLDNTLQSILGQTLSNLEVVLVDDGSKDNSHAVCMRYAAQDARVKVIQQANAGSAAARNTGLLHATGEYVTFADADDTVDCEYYERLYAGVLQNNADVCVGNIAFTRTKGEEVLSRETVTLHGGAFTLQEFMQYYPAYMPKAIIGSPCNKLYRRAILEANQLRFDTTLRNNEDTHFNYRFLPYCKTVYVSESPFYNYLQREGVQSASRRYIPNVFDIYVSTYEKALEFLEKTGTLSENVAFQNQYFMGLVIGAINGLVHAVPKLSKKECCAQIRAICTHPDVCAAAKTAHFQSHKHALALKLIQKKNATLLYLAFSAN